MAFIGGFSAATGMVIVASVALVHDDQQRSGHAGAAAHPPAATWSSAVTCRSIVLRVRRVAIVGAGADGLHLLPHRRRCREPRRDRPAGLRRGRPIRTRDHRRAVLARRQSTRRRGRAARRFRRVWPIHCCCRPSIRSRATGCSDGPFGMGLVAAAGPVLPQRLGSGDARHLLVVAGQRRPADLHLAALSSESGRTPACGDVHGSDRPQRRRRRRLARPRAGR